MADAPVHAIVQTLAEALRKVTIANGFFTDLGDDVHTELTEKRLTAPRTTVWCNGKERARSGERRPADGRALEGWIEVAIPSEYDNAMALAYQMDEDIDRLLSGDLLLLPNALPAQYEESVVLPRPDGLPQIVVQVRWSSGYRFRSGS